MSDSSFIFEGFFSQKLSSHFFSLSQKKEIKIHCFGKNNFGQLGIESIELKQNNPQAFNFFESDEISILILGGEHCLVLISSRKERKVFGWGRNDYGQIGIGNNSHQNLPKEILFFQGKSVKLIACGFHFSLCLTFERGFPKKNLIFFSSLLFKIEVFSWGDNSYGQLGHGDQTKRNSPSKVSQLDGKEIQEIACEGYSSFVWNQNSLFSWGNNSSGQLGLGDFEDKTTPQERSIQVIVLVCGESHCFCLSKDLKIWSWGLNYFGQLGLGIKESKISTPQEVLFFQNHDEIHSIACGGIHSLFWTSQGLFACGDNYYNQLGLGEEFKEESSNLFQEVSFFKEKQILSIGTGCNHSFCLTSEGLYGWGNNYYDQLSFEEKTIPLPRKVSFLNSNSRNISIGRNEDFFIKERNLFLILCRELISSEENNLFDQDYLPLDLFKIFLNF